MNKVLLCILDGFGYSEKTFGNATKESEYIWELFKSEESALLEASGKYVGLPDGQVGNSEVGHLTIGSGRILKQKLPLITDAIDSGELAHNKTLTAFLSNIQNNTCHLMGLFSNGGVHSDIKHFFWAIKFLRKNNIKIRVHLFLDGRDVGYRDGLETLSKALNNEDIKVDEIATIQGRFFAMDRDNRWDRTEQAYNAIAYAEAEIITKAPLEIIKNFYDQNINDEMIPPLVMDTYSGADEGDSFWMLNFRTDRIKQILSMLINNKFKLLNMVNCGEEIDKHSSIIFESTEVKNTLGEVLANFDIPQLRIAETEKYAHVTYFLNGGKDIQYHLEDRILIPSLKVPNYEETPDMRCPEISDHIVDALQNEKYRVIIANFASPDMIGHTGNFKATRTALRLLDQHLRKIIDTALKNNFYIIVTADHGNAEDMINQDQTPMKTHTCSKVPFIFIQNHRKFTILRKHAELADIAPTILNILDIPRPNKMSGRPLVD
ncbi:MAG: 2,3-bisphosphoglycerate-independent phosphoglycerate mutase [Holosporales bacterium]|jgi:2,3-bisphosphoglycerate-independent phosphoglycerate mutase|nr:2,3-bisphosphoglycerate-independent phosphoglycerate mutase [Holosporales bacterium]